MSAMNDLLTRTCTQTCVYWGNPQDDGFGTKIYAPPREILCRWESKLVLVRALDEKGATFDYNTVVYVLEDLAVEGVLCLATLAELSDSEESDPLIPEGAYTIKQFEKIPVLYSTTEFVRRAFLTQWRYR